jgi:alkylation response protein AidB-like acyl-CoA dehydrogenase
MYTPPIKDMMFVLNHAIDIQSVKSFADGDLDIEMAETILEEAGRLARDVLDPLNKSGHENGIELNDGVVTTAKGFKEAYNTYRENGWNSVPFNAEFGGQEIPWSLAVAVQEMWQASNMSFGLCPLLNQGAVEAIDHHGSDDLKSIYLEKLISGEWTGTMNLTEPHSGSDLSIIKSMAAPQDDGTFKVSGQKIFITYGEHDFADNIIHLVLARVPDAPEGVKGLSLFLVPKFLVNDDGSLGERNDVYCTGIEHKIGIHASPTCTMQFGDNGGATGYLVGDLHQGLRCMFTMMNSARLSVGLQGVAISDRAIQHAQSYAQERVQGGTAIINHPDVDRMLNTMRVLTVGGRMIAYNAMYHVDLAAQGDETATSVVDILTPIVKSWCTDRSVDVTSMGVQVHGGMGFIEETGAAQYYRDSRILPIYEGTNGIQAIDLHGRKLLRDQGVGVTAYIAMLRETVAGFACDKAKHAYSAALDDLLSATACFLARDLKEGLAYNCYYLDMFGYILAGYFIECALENARKAGLSDADLSLHKQDAEFYRIHILPRFLSQYGAIKNGLE